LENINHQKEKLHETHLSNWNVLFPQRAVGLGRSANADWQISDSMCGKSHSGMGEMGKNPKECTLGCVKSGGKYVFVSGDKVMTSRTRRLRI